MWRVVFSEERDMEECLELNGTGIMSKAAARQLLAGAMILLLVICVLSYGCMDHYSGGNGKDEILSGESKSESVIPGAEMEAPAVTDAAAIIKEAAYEIPENLVIPGVAAELAEAEPETAAPESAGTELYVPAAGNVLPEMTVENVTGIREEVPVNSGKADIETSGSDGIDRTAEVSVAEVSAADGRYTETETTVLPEYEETAAVAPDHEGTVTALPDHEETAAFSAFRIDQDGMLCGFAPEYAEIADGVLSLPSEGCRGIRRGVFLGVGAGITEIRIPANIICIEEGALMGLDDLLYISVDEGNPAYATQDGVLYDSSVSILLAFPNGRTGGYLVPGSVVRVADGAFYHTSVEILDMRGCMELDPETVKIDGVRVLLPQSAE